MLTALLLLLLLTGLSLAAVMSVNSGLLVNGYYRNTRGSFYAADSGLSLARQVMLNQVATDSAGWAPATSTSYPISTTEDTSIHNAVISTYGNWTAVTGSGTGNAASSWPEQFEITQATIAPQYMTITCSSANCTVGSGSSATTFASPITCTPNTSTNTGFTCPNANAPSNATAYNYYYAYTLSADGKTSGSQAANLGETGYLVVNASQAGSKTSFAGFGMFINTQTACSSGDLVPGTISGPVFTNGAWTFGTGTYNFTGTVGQAAADAGFDFGGGNCISNQSGPSVTSGKNTIAPNFSQGFNEGQNTVPLPANSFSQEQAVVDAQGQTAFNQASPNNHLNTIGGAAYPTSGTPANGVYLPYQGSAASGTATFLNGPNGTSNVGGILVQGDAQITLSTGTTSGGIPQQIYQIVQGSGSSAVTTTITITPGASPPSSGQYGTGTTLVSQTSSSGTVSGTIQGVPVIETPAGVVTGDATMLYVNGNVTSLSGPSSGAAIANYSDVTVTAADNITITGNITYATEPVNSSDVLTSNSSQAGVLGIFTAGTGCSGSTCGDINLQVPTAGQNLEIDASIACISSVNQGGLVNTGNAINTLNIVGGRIQNTIQNINTTTRNVLFDQRFANGAVSPPWFPSTTITPTNFAVTSNIQRLTWLNNSSSF